MAIWDVLMDISRKLDKINTNIEKTGSDSGGGSSDAGGLVVPEFTVIMDENNPGTIESVTCDLTYEEVKAAVKAGKCLYALSDYYIYWLSEFYEGTDNEDPGYINFLRVQVDNLTGAATQIGLGYEESGNIYVEYPSLNQDNNSGDDNGDGK